MAETRPIVIKSSMPHKVQVQLCLDLRAGRDLAARAGRRWFQLGLDLCGHELRDQLQEAVATKTYLGMDNKRRVEGNLGTICSATRVAETGPRKWSAAYSPKAWSKLRYGLDHLTTGAGLAITTWETDPKSDPWMLFWGHPTLDLAWTVFDEAPDWLFLTLHGTENLLVGPPDRQANLLQLVQTVADECGPTFAEVSYDYGSFRTALEDALGRLHAPQTVAQTRTVVRGYSWLTIVSEEIGERLGGLEGLSATDAFHDVAHLTNGGYWLLATSSFQDYQIPQARRVAQALAPALPKGTPRERAPWDEPNMIVPDGQA